MATAPSRLCIVSNRLPVTVQHDASGDFRLERSAGGLATALERPHAAHKSLWIGWPGDTFRTASTRQHLESLLRSAYSCVCQYS